MEISNQEREKKWIEKINRKFMYGLDIFLFYFLNKCF